MAFAQSGANDSSSHNGPGLFEKAPFNMLIEEAGGGVFSPRNSSASAPTQNCAGGFPTTTLHYDCAEQFTRVEAFHFAGGVRPIRYFEAKVGFDFLGDFNGYKSITAPYQCVSGCTGVVNENIVTSSILTTTDFEGVLPLFREHLLISGGGGIGWLQVRSHPQTNAQVEGTCIYCPPPQGGHGPTEIAELTYFPSRYIGIGLQIRNVQVSSPGLTAVAGPVFGPITYKDRFFLIGGNVSLRLWKHH